MQDLSWGFKNPLKFLPDVVTPATAQFGAVNSDSYIDLNGNGDNEERLALYSQVWFQNELYIDNLIAKTSRDDDSDGI